MDPATLSFSPLLRELRNLGLVTREQSAHLTDCEDRHDCAASLVEAGVLTAYQAEQVLAGQGRTLYVGPYVLQERLGRGGMGHVYKAEHRLLKRVVALKIAGCVRRDGSDLPMLVRFQREVEAAGRVRHPGIVTTFDAGEADGRLYLAMEYIEGIDLERFVKETGPLPIDLACEVVRQTAETLHHVHKAGLLHYDIKPTNLMLTPPGVTMKLLDLGLAQFTDKMAPPADGESIEEELCGTPSFMAPECVSLPRMRDPRSDLYSLGCTFYYLLTGQVPFPGGNWMEKLLRQTYGSPVNVRERRPDVPETLAAVIERLMARAPEDRYASAADVVDALRAPLPAVHPCEVKREMPARQARRGPKVRRLSCAAVVAILLGVAAAGGARWIVTPPSAPRNSGTYAAASKELPFTIEGRAGEYASLEKTIAAARDGETILVHGTGPFITRPLNWRDKALTVRSDGRARARLELKASADPWQALFRTDRKLTLEGIDLALAAGSADAPLIYSEGASLDLKDCRLTAGADGVAVIARNPDEVIVRGCRIEAGAVALSVEVGARETLRMQLADTTLSARGESGAALSLWAPEVREATAVRVELEHNTIQAGRIIALRALPSGLSIAALHNRFLYRSALLSYSGYADGTAWRGTVWQGESNSREGPTSWLWVEGRPAAALPNWGS